jgi:hypothetical protein
MQAHKNLEAAELLTMLISKIHMSNKSGGVQASN